jgi:hypothetical protein
MPGRYTRDELVERLVRAGELEISGENQDEADTYFDTENLAFHGPGGFDADYAGLTGYFRSLWAAFDDRTIRRESSSPRASTSPARHGSKEHSRARSRSRPPGASNPPVLVSSWTS